MLCGVGVVLVLLSTFIPHVLCGRVTSSKDISINRGSTVSLQWTIQPFFGETAKWLTIYHAISNSSEFKEIWSDEGGILAYGKQKFADRLNVSYKFNKMVEVSLKDMMDSIVLSLTLVFMDKENTILGGPYFSKVKINVNMDIERLTSKPVCYGAKGDTPALVKIKRDSLIKSIKLQHVSGELRCANGRAYTYWGCEVYPFDKLLMIITDTTKQALFPVKSYTIGIPNFYSLPGYNHLSTELVIPTFNGKSVRVTKNQELKIWYSEDLVKFGQPNNSGKHCVHVFAIHA